MKSFSSHFRPAAAISPSGSQSGGSSQRASGRCKALHDGPCQILAPVMEKLAEQYDGKAVVAKVDVDEQQMLAIQYGVMSVPTVLFLKNGEEVGRLVGVQPAETYAQTLDKLL